MSDGKVRNALVYTEENFAEWFDTPWCTDVYTDRRPDEQ